jgi:hypothetical protein
MITVSSRPSKNKNGSESQSKLVSAVLKGKKEGGKTKKTKTKQNKRGIEFRTARSCHFRLTSFGQVYIYI